MKLEINLPAFRCPNNMTEHLQHVFSGEYDVPVDFFSPTILDLGANCGAFAVWATHRWPYARVHAYEPHPRIFAEFLKVNLGNYPNVFLNPHGIGTPGTRILYDGTNNIGETSFYQMGNNMNLTGQHIEVRSPLSLPEADILKMDIEGCEIEVLRPLIEDGRSFTLILAEYHSEALRIEMDELLRKDYQLIKSSVVYIGGRGTVAYLNKKVIPWK
jgi:FkbM family methyltransferase